MNKSEFITLMTEETTLNKKESEIALNAVIKSIEKVIENKDNVNFVGFGTFGVKERAEREGRNPRTKEIIKIAATTVPYFKAGKTLKEQCK